MSVSMEYGNCIMTKDIAALENITTAGPGFQN